MKTYTVKNKNSSEKYTVKAPNTFEVRHWIINHLDLSQSWDITEDKQ